ncbi:PPOX class F420-dependent oxidoreductase [Gordonia sp. X0973]|uniref:PPOX class F420-dependent oxidoreductase n=1 Tax=Gordonia sp. X0973 TaxID=2742602 RepID=UPI000F523B9E|nr:PPOX class F420-dependent oxidoreductase [Gordonia sp. X0973]QKT08744.1 PPOX class F420-dependent oxidoreductase [Gordonia sp. X0973]
MAFTESELAYLASQRLGRMATQKPNGTLQNSPVGFKVNADGTIDVVGYQMSDSRKYRNIVDNGRVALVVDDVASVNPWRVRCVEIRGRGEAVPPTADAGAKIRIHPTRVISFGLDEDRDAHSLTVDARDV